jgi:hypothetical protein
MLAGIAEGSGKVDEIVCTNMLDLSVGPCRG